MLERRPIREDIRGAILAATVMALLIVLPSCSRIQVHTLADPGASFTAYETFAFLPKGGMKNVPGGGPRTRIIRDPLFHAHVQAAVEEDLLAKGYRRISEPSHADVLVGYRTAMKDQAEVMPAVYGVGWRGRVHQVRPAHVKWYKEGTLVIDLIDRRGEHLVWRGVGVGAMRDMKPGEELREAVGEIMNRYPPEG